MIQTTPNDIRLSFAGDLMLGRGVDQVLKFPTDSRLYENAVKNSKEYVLLIQSELKRQNKVYELLFWSPIMNDFHKFQSHLFFINLETAITHSLTPYPKGINYKLSPDTVYILKKLEKDIFPSQLIVSLANNHILDWKTKGLIETIEILKQNNIKYIGAGSTQKEAETPMFIDIKEKIENKEEKKRIVVFACGHTSSGIPEDWKAIDLNPGLFLLFNELKENILYFQDLFKNHSITSNDIKILLIHYGSNWITNFEDEWKKYIKLFIYELGFTIILNTSSHHTLPTEQIKILKQTNDNNIEYATVIHGPGDFINDYYGILNPEHDRFKPNQGKIVHVSFKNKFTKPSIQNQNFERIGFNLYPIQIKN